MEHKTQNTGDLGETYSPEIIGTWKHRNPETIRALGFKGFWKQRDLGTRPGNVSVLGMSEPVFSSPYISTALCSGSSLLPEPYIPKVPTFPDSYTPKAL